MRPELDADLAPVASDSSAIRARLVREGLLKPREEEASPTPPRDVAALLGVPVLRLDGSKAEKQALSRPHPERHHERYVAERLAALGSRRR